MKETIVKLKDIKSRIGKAREFLELPEVEEKIRLLEIEMEKPDFWSDQRKAKEKSEELSALKEMLTKWNGLEKEAEELLELAGLAEKDDNEDLYQEIRDKTGEFEKRFEKEEFVMLFSGKYDKSNAILAIHSGAGGTESCDWAEMLERMYLRFAESMGFRAKIVDRLAAEEAGIKNVTIEISGKFAYGYLKGEAGVHRLVRISPFDASKSRHTSFALVEVIPEIEQDAEVELEPKDIKVETFRASGAGGQYVQKTSSAVRITHLATKISVSCQSERSQHQNKEQALKVLKSRLAVLKIKEEEEKIAQIRGEAVLAGWGNQIRSYVLHPYQMVKDHRTNFETSNTKAVLGGELEGFIEAYLRSKK